MAEVKKQDFCESAPILDKEDEATLAAIDRGTKPPAKAGFCHWEKSASECASGLQNPLHRRRVS
jgi:hypothetical protein